MNTTRRQFVSNLGQGLAGIALASMLHRDGGKREVFKRNHPGGAIGMTHRELEVVKKADVDVEALELPSPSISADDEG